MRLPAPAARSRMLESAHVLTVGFPGPAWMRVDGLPPYSWIRPRRVLTVNDSGPLPATPLATICENVSSSVAYTEPGSPYTPLTSLSCCPSRQNRSAEVFVTPPAAPSCATVRWQREIAERPDRDQPCPSVP